MTTTRRTGSVYRSSSEIFLHNGDCMSQSDFHEAYLSMPDDYRAELIGGIVYEPSPVDFSHGTTDGSLGVLLGFYAGKTPGLDYAQGATVILSKKDEVQPDLLVRIKPECGGQSHNKPGQVEGVYYVEGAPELVAEISHSSYSIDLHVKRKRFAMFGVLEYIVVCLNPRQLYWFNLRTGRQLKADDEGIFKSKIFPGLWIDSKALLEQNFDRSIAVLNQGLDSREHKELVSKLKGLK